MPLIQIQSQLLTPFLLLLTLSLLTLLLLTLLLLRSNICELIERMTVELVSSTVYLFKRL